MKRQDAIKQIVKKSYDARYKALHEAAKENPLTLTQAPATKGGASSTSATSGAAAGASSSGGNSTVKVRMVMLKKKINLFSKGDKILLTEKQKREVDSGKQDDGYVVYPTEEIAKEAKVADPTLEDMSQLDEVKEAPVEASKVILDKTAFSDNPDFADEAFIFPEGRVPIEEIQIEKAIPGDEIVCADGDEKCWHYQYDADDLVYNIYEAIVDNPNPDELILDTDNVEIVG